jgi:predicted transcriptional regulator
MLLADIRRRREQAPTRAQISAAIVAARAAGMTAVEIADALGVQRQGLYKRFHAEITSGGGE